MRDYIFLMHSDASGEGLHDWAGYLEGLRHSGRFEGGSSIGGGASMRKDGAVTGVAAHLSGYLKIRANDLEDALRLLMGNPVYEGGGTVEVRELVQD